jgi:hypothetical protein
MDPAHDELLGRIEVFLARSGMTPTAFGYEAMKDPAFVFDLRAGRECRRATRAKADRFMAAFTPAEPVRRAS